MRLVIDNNILVSALVWRGLPRRVLDEGLEAGWKFFSSPALLSELERVLHYPRLAQAIVKKGQSPQALFGMVCDILRIVDTIPLAHGVCRDPDDDAVLACALAAHADAIVSGDQDLLVLGIFEGIPILTASQMLERLS